MKRTANIDQILRPLKETPFQAYLSNAVQVADILEWILEQVGTAEVWQTSFSISEEFLRRLFFITKDKKVSRINLVLDHKATNKTLMICISFMRRVSAELHSNEPPHQGGQTDARGHGRNGGCRGRRNRCLMCRRDPRPKCSTGRKQGGFRKQVWQ